MDLLVLIAVLLLGLSILIHHRSSSSRRAPPPPPAPAVAVHKITDPAVAHRALVENADAFTERPVLPFFVNLAKRRGGRRNENISTVPYGPHWRALRRNITSETLHPSRLGLGNLAPLQREAIQDLVAALSAGAGAGLVRDQLRAAVFRVIARLCFGDAVDERRVRAICSQVHGIQVAIGEINPSPGSSMLAKLAKWRHQRQLLAFHARITQLCLPLIIAARQRRSNANDGGVCRPYVDSLVELRLPEGGGRRDLGDDEIVDLVLEFLGAGTGSLAVCLEWTLAHLVAQPDVQEKLRREVDDGDRSQLILRGTPYLQAVILESLRMHPPAPLALRHVQADGAATLVGGAANSDLVVLFILGEMGRDKKTWKDPDEFRPERFLPGGEAESVGPLPGRKETRMMPFGAGHRFCPGVGLAMAILKSFLAALVLEFEWAPPTDAVVVDLTELEGFLKTMKKPLSARLTRRTT
uniref:Uncharacterized protein n=1 Tax=Avena sativa TaxID=4498 RepID=A0ACD5ZXF8_AVESA